MDSAMVYITAPTSDEAKSLARALLEERLAACVNLIPGMRSLYHWQGEICEGEECILLVKTRKKQFAALLSFVKERHSYSVPCLLQLEVSGGNPDYLRWLIEQCSGKEEIPRRPCGPGDDSDPRP